MIFLRDARRETSLGRQVSPLALSSSLARTVGFADWDRRSSRLPAGNRQRAELECLVAYVGVRGPDVRLVPRRIGTAPPQQRQGVSVLRQRPAPLLVVPAARNHRGRWVSGISILHFSRLENAKMEIPDTSSRPSQNSLRRRGSRPAAAKRRRRARGPRADTGSWNSSSLVRDRFKRRRDKRRPQTSASPKSPGGGREPERNPPRVSLGSGAPAAPARAQRMTKRSVRRRKRPNFPGGAGRAQRENQR
jgi:hypothetical protein